MYNKSLLKSKSLFILLSFLSISVWGQNHSTILKAGFLGEFDQNGTKPINYEGFRNNGNFLLGLEKNFGEILSLNAGAEMPISYPRNSFPFVQFFAEPRFWLMKDQLSASQGLVYAKENFSGTYLSLALSYQQPIQKLDENYDPKLAELSYNRTTKNGMNYAVQFGKQLWGLIDFGIKTGIENSSIRQSFDINAMSFETNQKYTPFLKSYLKMHVPIGALQIAKKYQIDCKTENCLKKNNQLWKIELNDLLSISTGGGFINPAFAFEQKLGNTGLSINVPVKLLFARGRSFLADSLSSRPDENLGEPVYSPNPYFRQRIDFRWNPELRYYFNSPAATEKGDTKLQGLYLFSNFQWSTASYETKRRIWEIEKFGYSAFGAGFGFQKLLFGKILMENSLAYMQGNNTQNQKIKGIQPSIRLLLVK